MRFLVCLIGFASTGSWKIFICSMSFIVFLFEVLVGLSLTLDQMAFGF